MIKSRSELRFFIREDAKANYMEHTCFLVYVGRLFAGSESAHVFRYIKCLRHCEFHANNSDIIHRVLYAVYKLKLHRLGFKYSIRIPINVCDYGLSITHLAGGGVFLSTQSK